MKKLLTIAGEKKTDEEIISFVKNYKSRIESGKKGRYHHLLQLIPEGVTVLDYGCGWGAFSKMMEEKGNKVTGIDHSKNEVEICKLVWGGAKNLEFKNIGIDKIKSGSFDCLTSIQVIEHTHNPGNYLSECNRVLKKGGRIILSIPNIINPRFFVPLLRPGLKQRLISLSRKTRQNYQKNHDHIQAWDPAHFVRFVTTVGFELEDYAPMEGIPMPAGSIFRPLPSYIHCRLFKNYSYSMAFVFRKVEDSTIRQYD